MSYRIEKVGVYTYLCIKTLDASLSIMLASASNTLGLGAKRLLVTIFLAILKHYYSAVVRS